LRSVVFLKERILRICFPCETAAARLLPGELLVENNRLDSRGGQPFCRKCTRRAATKDRDLHVRDLLLRAVESRMSGGKLRAVARRGSLPGAARHSGVTGRHRRRAASCIGRSLRGVLLQIAVSA